MAVERTLSIIKPDAVAKNVIGQILTRFEGAGTPTHRGRQTTGNQDRAGHARQETRHPLRAARGSPSQQAHHRQLSRADPRDRGRHPDAGLGRDCGLRLQRATACRYRTRVA